VQQENSDGSRSTLRWVEGQAQGYGAYKIVAAVSMRFESVYDPAASAVLWLNLALAAAGSLGICVSVARMRNKKAVRTVWEGAAAGSAAEEIAPGLSSRHRVRSVPVLRASID
jgi:hypothetical protein